MYFTGPCSFSKFLNDALSVSGPLWWRVFQFSIRLVYWVFYFPVLHFAYKFNISFAIWFLNGVGSWDFVFSQFNVEVILTDTHDNVICVDVSKITSRNWTILLPYCSGSMIVSSRLQIWFWRSSLDFSTSKNFWDSESNFVDCFWIVSVRSLNADWISAWIVGAIAVEELEPAGS